MTKKYIIVGGVAGGTSAAARIRRLDESADITIFEKGDDISFSNCCLPNVLSGEIEDVEDVVFYNPTSFYRMFGLQAYIHHEVLSFDADAHTVEVKNLETNEVRIEPYDVLILSPGTRALRPSSIEGVNQNHVFTLKNVTDVRQLSEHIQRVNDDVVVVGGGFIGVEVAENLRKAGKNVSLVEASNQILATYDEDLVQILHKEMDDHGIDVLLNESVLKIESDQVVLTSGKTIAAQTVVLAIGIQPNVEFAQQSGVALGETGAIHVDQNFQTNLKDVYAIGDAIEVEHALTHSQVKLSLAGPAQKQARALADGLFHKKVRNRGVLGSSCIRVFHMNAARTGLNERECKGAGLKYETAYVIPCDRVGLMPGANPIHCKLIFEVPTGKVLGAQAIGQGNVVKAIDTIATIIHFGGDIYDVKDVELAYAPDYSTAKDVVNFAGIVATNLLEGVYKQVSMDKVANLVTSKAYILDVRSKEAFDAGHIHGAFNIPLEEFRNRYNEIPKDQPVYIHCRTSWNSYYAIQALKGYGYHNIINIQGSFLGLSYYTYFTDKLTSRPSILTNYNFK